MKRESRKERDAMSAMRFRIPAIEIVMSGEVRLICCLSARALRRCPAMTDLEECSLVAHATVGVLSQNIPMCACSNDCGAWCSRINHCMRCPAISKSLLVRSPSGLLSETSRF